MQRNTNDFRDIQRYKPSNMGLVNLPERCVKNCRIELQRHVLAVNFGTKPSFTKHLILGNDLSPRRHSAYNLTSVERETRKSETLFTEYR
jgi:hypothetical protein